MRSVACTRILLLLCLSLYHPAAASEAPTKAADLNDSILVACPTCREKISLKSDDVLKRCSCGEEIDARSILKQRSARLKRFGQVPAEEITESGCLACHRKIAVINSKMAFIRDLDGNGKGCVVCHEGDAGANTMVDAHNGLIPNPGDLWECSVGRGCSKCHSRKASLFSVTSTASDPIGQGSHVYRVERSLMSTQMGILNNALCANGLQAIGERPYANFDCDDPLGARPLSGTKPYSEGIAEAIRAQRIDRRPRVKALPTSEEARQKWGLPKAMIVDYYCKECARCHNWVDGAIWRGDRRSAGCSSCHVPYSNDAYYEGSDETLSRDEIRRPLRHNITNAIESIQCTRCHTRGKRIGVSYLGMMEFPFQSP